MSKSLEYIDRYFGGQLTTAERSIFENLCESDEIFAREVATYVSSRAVVEVASDLELKRELDAQYKGERKKTGRLSTLLSYMAIAAAACLAVFFGWQFLFKPPPASQIAEEFIQERILKSPTLMGTDNTKGSFATGKAAFYGKQYDKAARILESLLADDKVGSEAAEYLGKTYLVQGKYEQALSQFEALSHDKTIRVNYGSLYKAIALMRRSAPGDVKTAKRVLRDIIRKNLAGSSEAKRWIHQI